MPVGMMKIPTGPHAKLARFRDDPEGLRNYVARVVKTANAEADLVDLYFDVGKDHAYAVIKDLDDDVDVKAVSRILGADGYKKTVPVGKASEAVERERQIVEGLGESV
jgi:predicted HAD superfamily phosphohydrolase